MQTPVNNPSNIHMISEVEAEDLICKTHENRFKEDCFPVTKKMSDTRARANLFPMEPLKIGGCGTIYRRHNILDFTFPQLKMPCNVHQELQSKRQNKQIPDNWKKGIKSDVLSMAMFHRKR